MTTAKSSDPSNLLRGSEKPHDKTMTEYSRRAMYTTDDLPSAEQMLELLFKTIVATLMVFVSIGCLICSAAFTLMGLQWVVALYGGLKKTWATV